MKKANKKVDVYEMITSRIIEMLEAGTVPWHRPWSAKDAPASLKSKKAYRGINALFLAAIRLKKGYSSRYWVTFKQAKDLKGTVKKGEKGTPVIFWKWLEKENKEDPQKKDRIPILRYYTAFNIAQCDDIEDPDDKLGTVEVNPIEECERVASGFKGAPEVRHGGSQAYYRPTADEINMPKPRTFESMESYYGTLFHEMTHSTGHPKRLNRNGVCDVRRFGSDQYSKEELIAELGSAYLAGETGINHVTEEQSASYLNNWIDTLKGDSKLIIQAAGKAQRAVDHILGTTFDNDKEGN